MSSSWPAWRSWIARHRTKLIIAGVLIGTGVWLYRKYQRAMAQFKEFELRMVRIAQTEQFYEQNQRAALEAVIASQTLLHDAIAKLVVVPTASEIRAAMSSQNSQDRVAIWEKVKEKTFLQLYVSLFSFTLFASFHRVQLTILSREMFLESKKKSDPPTPQPGYSFGGLLSFGSTPKPSESAPLSDADKQAYLEQCQYFLSTGLVNMVAFIEQRLKDRLALLPLQQTITPASLRDLIIAFTKQLQVDFSTVSLISFLLDPAPLASSSSLSSLLAATKAELTSGAFLGLFREQTDELCNLLCTRASEALQATTPPPPLVKVLNTLVKLSDVMVPAEPGAGRPAATALFSTPTAQSYAKTVFGQEANMMSCTMNM